MVASWFALSVRPKWSFAITFAVRLVSSAAFGTGTVWKPALVN